MNYKKISFNNANLHIIKTERFKTFIIDVVFKFPVGKEQLPKYNFLSWLLNESSLKYPSKRKLSIELEELYKASYVVDSSRRGNNLMFSISIESINPKYLDDANHLNDIINFLFEVILNPNVKKNEFDKKSFDIVKNYMKIDIESVKENPTRTAFENALKKMDDQSISSYSSLGTLELLDTITSKELYDLYLNMLHHSLVDIFIIGDLEEKEILNNNDLINKLFNLLNDDKRKDCIQPVSNFVDNKEVDKVKYYEEDSNYLQSQLVMLYNTNKLTKKEQDVTMLLFNYIFGSGGLNSKLYSLVREKNGYCYQINSSYYKFDNILRVSSSLNKKNAKHTIELVNKCLKDMQDGNFTEEDLNDAKQSMILTLNYYKNSINSLLQVFENKLLNDGISIEEKIEIIATINKQDIINVAKKIRENTNYLLNEE